MRLLVPALLIIAAALLTAGCGHRTPPVKPPRAINGILDLSAWDFNRNNSINLNGQWAFYWDRLISPDDFAAGSPIPMTAFFNLPGCWNGFVIDNTLLDGNGFATFRLKLLLPPDDDTLKAVRILNQATSYKLWINGRLVAANGTVGKTPKTVTPRFLLQEKYFQGNGPVMDMVLQVANFHHRKGGVWSPILFGAADQIQHRHVRQWVFDLLLFGSLLIMGVYHLGLLILRKDEPSALYFAVFTLVFAVRVLVSGDYYLTMIWPGIPYSLVYRTELLTAMIAPPALLLFVSSLYNREKWPAAVRLCLGIAICFCAATIVLSIRGTSYLAIPNQVMILVNFSYAVVILVRALWQRKQGALILLLGIIVVVGTAVIDILNANQLLHTIDITPLGVLFLIFSQSYVLSSRFAGAFNEIRELSGQLAQKNIDLERMDRVKDEFLANTSHELRTPLNGIIGLADSLKQGAFGRLSATIASHLELIAASGRRLSGLLNDILDFSQLKNRDLRLDLKSVDIRVLADTVLAVSRPLATDKDLVLVNHIPETLPPVLGDESRLLQILYNLVGNAVKFTEKGEVSLTARQIDALVEVRVTDTGIGIEKKDHDTIFNAFEQARGSDERPFGGTGLGLAITKKLVLLHNGRIGVASQPGNGAVFYFTLPVSHAPATPELSPAMARINSPISGNTPVPRMPDRIITGDAATAPGILVVDDDPVNLRVVAAHLALMDHVRVHTVPGGQEALAFIEDRGCPDLILLDIMMPRMNGYEVCRILRKTYSASILPVIILTAKNRIEDLSRGFACGANDYLAKPFAGEELLARVNTQLDLKAAYETLQENLELKKEVSMRRRTELKLRMTQARLSRILDVLDDAILAVNENGEINFCNRELGKRLSEDADAVIGKPVRIIFPEDTASKDGEFITDMAARDVESFNSGGLEQTMKFQGRHGPFSCRVMFARFDLDQEQLLVMILQDDAPPLPGMEMPGAREASIRFIRELNRHRQRIRILEESLDHPDLDRRAPAVKEHLEKIDTTLVQLTQSLPPTLPAPDKRSLGLSAMTLAVRVWEACTGTDKARLADQSGLWNVYITENGFERTQTLDRYLAAGTFPKRPRWRTVLRTVDFVLLSCDTPSQDRDELEDIAERIRKCG